VENKVIDQLFANQQVNPEEIATLREKSVDIE
jgi:hypothetical protein